MENYILRDKELLKKIHFHSKNNKQELINAKKCGCFYCLKIFDPNEIKDWIKDKNGDTALCPYCMIDAVIPESNEYELNEKTLKNMNEYWM